MFKFKLTEDAKKLMELSDNPLITKYDFTPRRMTPGANGFDLSACIFEQEVVYPNEVVKIPLGVSINLDEQGLANYSTGMQGNFPEELTYTLFSFCGFLLPRSSNKMFILNNTIGLLDSDYKGELFAKVRNIGDECLVIKPGERIIQLVIMLSYVGPMLEVNSLGKSSRGEGGDGSTGKY